MTIFFLTTGMATRAASGFLDTATQPILSPIPMLFEDFDYNLSNSAADLAKCFSISLNRWTSVLVFGKLSSRSDDL